LLLAAYARRRDPADIQQAIDVLRAAVPEPGADPAGEGPLTAVLRVNLGEAVRLSSASGAPAAELRAEAATHLDLVIDAPAATTSVRVRAAITRAALATIDERWDEAVTGYRAAIDLLPRLTYRAMPLADRVRQLHDTSGLACDAAAAALNAERPELAVQLLEAGRSVLLTQELDLRGDLTELHRALPGQAAELERLRAELDPLTDGGTPTGEHPAATADRRHWASRRWQELVDTIRAHPDFADFHRVPHYAALAEAAADAPVVIVNISRLRSDALVIRTGGALSVVPLPKNSPDTVTRMISGMAGAADAASADHRLTEALRWLWETIAEPVLTELGHRELITDGRWPQVHWLPTGLLAFLPLHAAGSDPSVDAVLDRVVSSYTTTLRALLRARGRRTPPDRLSNAIVVTVPPEVLSKSEDEGRLVHQALRATRPILASGPTTRSDVLAALPEIGWAHFACHATAVAGQPSQSTLDVGDPPLALTDLTRLDIDAHLAYLSACSTAQGSTRVSDETIHMAAAFHLAGFRHVVGTLWPVGDWSAYQFAKHTYAELAEDPYAVAMAVHRATRRLRAGHGPFSWASHMHLGPATAEPRD
jgi:hypothetical protein